jgi:hypothetical protein
MSCDGRRVRRREGRGVRGVGEWGVVRRRAHPVRPVVLEAAAVDLSGAVVRGQTRSGIVGDEAARDCGGGVLQQHQPVQAVAPHAAVGGLEARAGRGGAPKVHVGAERLSRNAAAVGAGHLVAVERGAHEQDRPTVHRTSAVCAIACRRHRAPHAVAGRARRAGRRSLRRLPTFLFRVSILCASEDQGRQAHQRGWIGRSAQWTLRESVHGHRQQQQEHKALPADAGAKWPTGAVGQHARVAVLADERGIHYGHTAVDRRHAVRPAPPHLPRPRAQRAAPFRPWAERQQTGLRTLRDDTP